MKKNLIICGEPCTGKSVLANWIASNHNPENVAWVNGRGRKLSYEIDYALSDKKDTTLIIIEELSIKKVNYDLFDVILAEQINVNPQGRRPFTVPAAQFQIVIVFGNTLDEINTIRNPLINSFEIIEVKACGYTNTAL